jgi:hypothetical protein
MIEEQGKDPVVGSAQACPGEGRGQVDLELGF